MQLIINGDARDVEGVKNVSELLALFELNERIIVVEHNGEIVQRGTYGSAALSDGDTLEIVQMSAGG